MPTPASVHNEFQTNGIVPALLESIKLFDKWARLALFDLKSIVTDEQPYTHYGVDIDLGNPHLEDVRSGFILGDYESADARIVEEYIPESTGDIIELGGGCGFVSACINRHATPSQTQITVEANPDLIPVIEDTRKRNDCNFTIVNRAYSTEKETVELNLYGNYPSHSINSDRTAAETIEVETTTISDLIDEHMLDDFVLVSDIEGAEVDLIDNEGELLESQCRLLLLEFHDLDNYSLNEYREKVKSLGFTEIDRDGLISVYRNESLTD